MIKPYVLRGADGIVLQGNPGPVSETMSPLSGCNIPAASARLFRESTTAATAAPPLQAKAMIPLTRITGAPT
jgi:hypothetical protein